MANADIPRNQTENKPSRLLPRLNETSEEARRRVAQGEKYAADAVNSAYDIDAQATAALNTGSVGERRRHIGRYGVIGVLGVAGVAAAQSQDTARAVYNLLQPAAHAYLGEDAPNPEDAMTVRIGDRIRFKDKDGHIKTVKIETLSDIADAAKEVNPDIHYGAFSHMLALQRGGSENANNGDAYAIDKGLGVEDIGQ